MLNSSPNPATSEKLKHLVHSQININHKNHFLITLPNSYIINQSQGTKEGMVKRKNRVFDSEVIISQSTQYELDYKTQNNHILNNQIVFFILKKKKKSQHEIRFCLFAHAYKHKTLGEREGGLQIARRGQGPLSFCRMMGVVLPRN